MTSLFTSLNVALSGLQTTQTLLNTTTRNITNAQTPNYVKKEQTALTNSSGAGGVLASAVKRSVDELLLNKQRQNTAETNFQQTRADALEKINQLAGDPAKETSLNGLINALGNKFQALAAQPNDPGTANAVLYAAEDLTIELNRQTGAVLSLQQEAQISLSETVTDVNRQLETIADLNVRILSAEGKGIDASDMKDARDKTVQDLAKNVDVRAFYDSEGVLNIYTKDFKPLATQYAEVVTYKPTGNTLSISSGTIGSIGGTLGALQQVANTDTVQYLRQLDEIARNLTNSFANLTPSFAGTVTTGSAVITNVTNFSGLYAGQTINDPKFGAGATITAVNVAAKTVTISSTATAAGSTFGARTPIPLFIPDPTPASPPYYSGQMQVNPALEQSTSFATLLKSGTSGTTPSVTVPAGVQNNDVVAAQAAKVLLKEGQISFSTAVPVVGGVKTFGDAASSITIAIGQTYSNVKSKITDLQTFGTQVGQSIAAKSEVNLDSELSNMVVLQNLYTSNARVVSITQKMLDDLLGLVR